jgi:hypothetical protein
LKESMNILSLCYHSDRRRTYHAITYADLAIKYAEALPGDDAVEYLRTARNWLADEFKASPWSEGVRRLLPIVERKLGR